MRVVKSLYVQVLIGIALGILVGILWPKTGEALKPLGDGFVKLIKVVIAPIVFCTVASGIAHMGDLKRVGRVGVKALVYFEVVSTFALAIGLLVGTLFHPGAGFNANAATLDTTAVTGYVEKAHGQTVAGTLLGFIPDSFFGAFAGGDLLQVLLLAILTGFALPHLGERAQGATKLIGEASNLFFSILRIIVRAAPIGAFGAMAFTVGKFGTASLVRLGALVGTFYLTAALFVIVVLGLIARATGFSIFRFLRYIKEELLLVLGTSSSETVLPQMMAKLERLGVSKPVVGLVVPAGYSFNLDGTNIYMTLATLFLAQATNTHLSPGELATLLLVAMLTSKGATGVTGSGFITLAATLAAVPNIPVTALALIFGVDRFMSECRALTNVIGNGIAAIAVGKWEGELDTNRLAIELGTAGTSAATSG